jgi:hypothetical protein
VCVLPGKSQLYLHLSHTRGRGVFHSITRSSGRICKIGHPDFINGDHEERREHLLNCLNREAAGPSVGICIEVTLPHCRYLYVGQS